MIIAPSSVTYVKYSTGSPSAVASGNGGGPDGSVCAKTVGLKIAAVNAKIKVSASILSS